MSEFWVGPDGAPETYQLIALLGGGGEGEVWRAQLPLSDSGRSEVAVKIMPATGSDGEVEDWQRVAHLLRSLAHPGLVRVTDAFVGVGSHRAGETDSAPRSKVLVMDYVEGPTMRDWIDENPTAPASSRIALLRTVASALDEMHSGRRTEVPVAHGDVKPANIVVSGTGSAVLVDLGLARLADARGVVGRSNPYAAPELRGADAQATPAADAFAFAATLAQVLVGVPLPTDANGFLDLAGLHALLTSAEATRNRPRLVQQVLDVLNAAPADRPKSLRSWLDATLDTLSQVTETGSATSGFTEVLPATTAPPGVPPAPGTAIGGGEPEKPRRRTGLVVAAVVVLLLAAGGGAFAVLSSGGDGKAAADDTSAVDSTPTPTPTPTPTEEPTPTPTPTSTAEPTLEPTDVGPDTTETTRQWVNQLGTVDSAGGYADSDGYQTNGKLYPHSIRMEADCYEDLGGSYFVEYDLARQWSTLSGVIGLDDNSPSNGRISWKIIGDGKLLKSGANALGSSTKVTVPVTGVLRLRIQIQDNSVAGDNCPDPESALILGDLELVA